MLQKCVKAPKLDGERIRLRLKKLNLLNKNYKIKVTHNFIYFPVKDDSAKMPEGLIFEKCDVEPIALERPKKLESGYDVVGDLAIINCSNRAHEIAEEILTTRKNIRTVLAATSPVRGNYRLKDFVVIAGENNTSTYHKEFGNLLFVDLSKAYFSPRLSTERNRVASLVTSSEIVVDMFAGVGPFTVLIAKRAKKVVAFDINPDAFNYLKKNIRLNKLQNVETFLGDARELSLKFMDIADRVIMNLPHSAIDFLNEAVTMINKGGGMIHYYDLSTECNFYDTVDKVVKIVERNGRTTERTHLKKVRSYAPDLYNIVIDIKIASLNRQLN